MFHFVDFKFEIKIHIFLIDYFLKGTKYLVELIVRLYFQMSNLKIKKFFRYYLKLVIK